MAVNKPLRVVYNPLIVGVDGRQFMSINSNEFGLAFVDPISITQESIRQAVTEISGEGAARNLNKALNEYYETGKKPDFIVPLFAIMGERERTLLQRHEAADGNERLRLAREYISQSRDQLMRGWQKFAMDAEENKKQSFGHISGTLAASAAKLVYQPPESDAHDFHRRVTHLKKFHPLSPDYLKQRENISELVAKALKALPINVRTILLKESVPVYVDDQMRLVSKAYGTALVFSGAILLDGQMVCNDPERAKLVFTEEALHIVDDKLKFSARPQWQEAVQRQIPVLGTEVKDILTKIHGDQKASYGPDSEYSAEQQPVELLVDYFHVRNFLHHERAKAWKLPSIDKVNKKMQELFPEIHELAQQFEKETAKRAASPVVGRGPFD
jgi:hypothetical protein